MYEGDVARDGASDLHRATKIPVLSWPGELEKVREQAGAAYLLIEQRDLKLLSELWRKSAG